MFETPYGQLVTAASAEAADAFARAEAGYATFRADTPVHLKAALKADPEMPMAHCLMGIFMKLMANGDLLPRAAASLEKARAQAGRASDRERRHMDGLEAWCRHGLTAAVPVWQDILIDHPRDMLALRLAYFGCFDLGWRERQLDIVAGSLDPWAGHQAAGLVTGMYAFSLEECGDLTGAERAGRDAVSRDPKDAWAAHAVAHVLEMQDRHQEGVAWIDGLLPHWDDLNVFVGHVRWHRALYLLDAGDLDGALADYDGKVRADTESEDPLDLTNGVSLLWRLEAQGVDVGDRWRELAEKSARRTADHIHVFLDAHYAMALAGGDRQADLQRLIEGTEALPQEAPGADVQKRVGVPLYRAIAALRDDRPGEAYDLLRRIRYDIRDIGGSHAQRDVFESMLIAAARDAGNYAAAARLLAERTHAKPHNPDAWRAYARCLAQTGDAGNARRAEARASVLFGSPS